MSTDSKLNLPTDLSFNFTDQFRVNHSLSFLLGLRSIETYCKSLPFDESFAACVEHVVKERELDIDAVKKSALLIPQSGPLLITSNHPTGILDGAVLLCAILSRRSDVLIVANDLLTEIPLLGDFIIPIKKTSTGDQNGLRTLIHVRKAWNLSACVVVFPAGTVEHLHWKKFKVCDAPWTDAFQNLAKILKVPEISACLSLKNPLWFHLFAAISKHARSALLILTFLDFKNKNILSPVTFKIKHKYYTNFN